MAEIDVPRTSLAEPVLTGATVRFNRWTAFGNTAYQRGQAAGVTRAQAVELVRRGIAILVEDDVLPAKMVRK